MLIQNNEGSNGAANARTTSVNDNGGIERREQDDREM